MFDLYPNLILVHPSKAEWSCRRSGGTWRFLQTDILCYTGGNELVLQLVISRPVIMDLWQPVDPHDDHKIKLRSAFFEVGFPCCGSVCSSETLCCKQVGLLDNERQDFLIDIVFKHLQWVPLLVVTSGPTGLVQGSTWTRERVMVHPIGASVHVCGHVYIFVLCVIYTCTL